MKLMDENINKVFPEMFEIKHFLTKLTLRYSLLLMNSKIVRDNFLRYLTIVFFLKI